jgi:hypothetical protein
MVLLPFCSKVEGEVVVNSHQIRVNLPIKNNIYIYISNEARGCLATKTPFFFFIFTFSKNNQL